MNARKIDHAAEQRMVAHAWLSVQLVLMSSKLERLKKETAEVSKLIWALQISLDCIEKRGVFSKKGVPMKALLTITFLLLCAPVGAEEFCNGEPNPDNKPCTPMVSTQLTRGDDPSMWVLVFFVGHTYFVDPKNYPAWDVRVFTKECDCDAAALALNKGIDVDRDYRGKDYAYKWYECVYEPEWLDKPWHAYPEIRHGWGDRMKAWWNARIYGLEELWRTQ